MADIAHRCLDTVEEVSRRNRFRINLHLDADGHGSDSVGWVLPDAIRQHLTCDGLISPIFVEWGVPVSVGRSQHLVPVRTRNLVLLRDGGCRVPGCDARHHLEIHHIVHWEHGGPTDTRHLVALCPRHHRLHHRGRLGITGNADDPNGVVFTNANGRRIEDRGAAPHPPNAPPPPIRGTSSPPLGERLDNDWIMFHPPPHHDGERRTN